jgi:hypothetical protein
MLATDSKEIMEASVIYGQHKARRSTNGRTWMEGYLYNGDAGEY